MKRVLVAVLMLAWSAMPAAASPILDFTGGSAANSATGFTHGFSFSIAANATVASLGFWDEGANGLTIAHPVGLWDAVGNLLASVTVSNASTPVASTGPGRWLFTSLGSPLNLVAGSYLLGAFYDTNADPLRLSDPLVITTVPGVTFGQAMVSFPPGPGLTAPLTTVASLGGSPLGRFGPNLQFADAAAVPEPASLALLGSGLALAFLVRRRSRRG